MPNAHFDLSLNVTLLHLVRSILEKCAEAN